MCLCCFVLRNNIFASLRLYTSSIFCYPQLNPFRIFLPAGKMEWYILLILRSCSVLPLSTDISQVLTTVTKCKFVIDSTWTRMGFAREFCEVVSGFLKLFPLLSQCHCWHPNKVHFACNGNCWVISLSLPQPRSLSLYFLSPVQLRSGVTAYSAALVGALVSSLGQPTSLLLTFSRVILLCRRYQVFTIDTLPARQTSVRDHKPQDHIACISSFKQ